MAPRPAVGDSIEIGEDEFANVFTESVKEVFGTKSGVTIHSKKLYRSPLDEAKTNNIMFFRFIVSVQEGHLGIRPVKVGSISFEMRQYYRGGHTAVTIESPATYPFVMPATHEEYVAEIKKGVHFLTSFLPNHFSCANKTDEARCQSFDDAYDSLSGCDVGIIRRN